MSESNVGDQEKDFDMIQMLTESVEKARPLDLKEKELLLVSTHRNVERYLNYKMKASQLNSMVDCLQTEISGLRKELDSRTDMLSDLSAKVELYESSLASSLHQLDDSKSSEVEFRIELERAALNMAKIENKLETSQKQKAALEQHLADEKLKVTKLENDSLSEAQEAENCTLAYHKDIEKMVQSQARTLTDLKKHVTSLKAELNVYRSIEKMEAAKKTTTSPYTATMLDTWIKEVRGTSGKKAKVPHITSEQWDDLLEISHSQTEERLRHLDRIRELELIRSERDDVRRELVQAKVEIENIKSLKANSEELIEANELSTKNALDKYERKSHRHSLLSNHFDTTETERSKLQVRYEMLVKEHSDRIIEEEKRFAEERKKYNELESEYAAQDAYNLEIVLEKKALLLENENLKKKIDVLQQNQQALETENNEIRRKVVANNIYEKVVQVPQIRQVPPGGANADAVTNKEIREALVTLSEVYARDTINAVRSHEQVRSENEKLKSSLEEMTIENEDVEKELKQTLIDFEKLKAKYDGIENRCKQLSKELTEALKQLKNKEVVFESQLINERKGRIEYEELNERLFLDLRKATTDLQNESVKRVELMERLKEAEKQLGKARNTVLGLTTGHDLVKVVKEHYEGELRSRVKNIEGKLREEQETKLAKHIETEKNLRRQLAMEIHERHKLQEKNKFLDAKIQRMNMQNLALEAENEELMDQTRQLVVEMDKESKKVTDLEKIVRTQEQLEGSGALGDYEASMTFLETKNNTLMNTVRGLKEEIAYYANRVHHEIREKVDLEEKCRNWQLQCVELNRKLGEVRKLESMIELERKRREMLEKSKRMVGVDLLETQRKFESFIISIRQIIHSNKNENSGRIAKSIEKELKMYVRKNIDASSLGAAGGSSRAKAKAGIDSLNNVKGILRAGGDGEQRKRKYSFDILQEKHKADKTIQEIMHRRKTLYAEPKKVTFLEMKKTLSF